MESTHHPERRSDRRRKRDVWYKVTKILTLISWVFFILALFVSHYAAPENDYGILRYYDIEIRETWIKPLADYLYIILWTSGISSYIILVIDRFRARRKTDNKHFNTFLLLLVVISWVSYLIFEMTK